MYNMAEIGTCPRFNALPRNLQYWNSCDQDWRRLAEDNAKYELLALKGK